MGFIEGFILGAASNAMAKKENERAFKVALIEDPSSYAKKWDIFYYDGKAYSRSIYVDAMAQSYPKLNKKEIRSRCYDIEHNSDYSHNPEYAEILIESLLMTLDATYVYHCPKCKSCYICTATSLTSKRPCPQCKEDMTNIGISGIRWEKMTIENRNEIKKSLGVNVDSGDQNQNNKSDLEEKPVISSSVQYCRKCGYKLASDSIFCSHCGTKVMDK
ncbi:MAG: zinc ribbon domain-containing protein [Christensenellales bacterium]